jgi:hypothetical protein
MSVRPGGARLLRISKESGIPARRIECIVLKHVFNYATRKIKQTNRSSASARNSDSSVNGRKALHPNVFQAGSLARGTRRKSLVVNAFNQLPAFASSIAGPVQQSASSLYPAPAHHRLPQVVAN